MSTHYVSWNVNGIRACLKKGFMESMQRLAPDALCLQETKCQAETLPDFEGFFPHAFFHYAEKKGYSGTALFCKTKPLSVRYDFEGHSGEGRVISAEFDSHYLVNAYVPNSGSELKRLDYRTREWEAGLRKHLCALAADKPVVYCGDLNVAHNNIDLENPGSNHFSAGFTDEEREAFEHLLAAGFTDSFRHLYPNKAKAYTWWSYRAGARARNVGWRIDYFLVSQTIQDAIKEAAIHPDIEGSDHCPVAIKLDI